MHELALSDVLNTVHAMKELCALLLIMQALTLKLKVLGSLYLLVPVLLAVVVEVAVVVLGAVSAPIASLIWSCEYCMASCAAVTPAVLRTVGSAPDETS